MQDEQSSKFYGVGVTINQRNGRIYVLGTAREMPAERAGLRYGDALIAVNGKSTRGWTQHDTQTFVRGDRGTPVELTVERLGSAQPITFRVVRDEVPFPSVRNAFLIRPGVGYIGLTGGFNQTTAEEVRDALAALKARGATSILLDLRRNPGGLFRQAIEVAEDFLPRHVDIVTVASRDARVGRNSRRRIAPIYSQESRRQAAGAVFGPTTRTPPPPTPPHHPLAGSYRRRLWPPPRLPPPQQLCG